MKYFNDMKTEIAHLMMLAGAVESRHPAFYLCLRATFTTMVMALQSFPVA